MQWELRARKESFPQGSLDWRLNWVSVKLHFTGEEKGNELRDGVHGGWEAGMSLQVSVAKPLRKALPALLRDWNL